MQCARLCSGYLAKMLERKKWVSRGSGMLKRKLKSQLKVLSSRGCNRFIIIHDLDRNPQNNLLNNEAQLRQILEQESSNLKESTKDICIPVEELEAWFWSDPNVVKHVGRGKGKEHNNPHLISKPKEALIRLSCGGKQKTSLQASI